ncbi:MAG TPA: LuxR C-terminal-related transcriptional regulator [Sphingomonas sp.]|jgi:DNA-binding CsgD family transcriptional regulator|nr:LuxR C-terminal-related transcriptional regulator [Sphingomonas sp.]
MESTRFDRLTKRHRECLQGVRQLKGSKEIADELGIEKSTVDSYLTEAVRVIGARNRRDAALQLERHEQELASVANTTTYPDPDKVGGDSARLVPPAGPLPIPGSPDELVVGQSGGSAERPATVASTGFRLPFRRKGQAGNDLSVGDRLIWIQVITLGLAIGFGMLMTGLQILTGLVEGVSRHLS